MMNWRVCPLIRQSFPAKNIFSRQGTKPDSPLSLPNHLLRHHCVEPPTPTLFAPQHIGQKVAVLLGGCLDRAVMRNQVTSSLTAITVITLGVVNCF